MTHENRRSGFSLLEILVVLAIATAVSSLVVGTFSTLQTNSRRSSCQANLAQIYRAIRLYTEDSSGPPPHSDPARNDDGLWLLWGFRDPKNLGQVVAPRSASVPIQGYLRSDASLHCPNDRRTPSLFDAAGDIVPNYLSYQVTDDVASGDTSYPSPNGDQTYFPRRTLSVGDPDYLRQLVHQRTVPGSAAGSTPYFIEAPTPATTIITWCINHRGLGSGRADNILFYDGSVKRMPTTQTCGTQQLKSWRRLPDCSTEGQGASTP